MGRPCSLQAGRDWGEGGLGPQSGWGGRSGHFKDTEEAG